MVGKLLCNSLNNFLNNAKLLRDAGGEIAIANPNICSFFLRLILILNNLLLRSYLILILNNSCSSNCITYGIFWSSKLCLPFQN